MFALALVLSTVMSAIGALAYFMQGSLIFPRGVAGSALAAAPSGVEQVWINIDDGARVEGWFIRGEGRSAESPGGAVVFFHGNAELIDSNSARMQSYVRAGVSVLLVEYRGYGRSDGRPSQRGIVEDSASFLDWLIARPEVNASRIVYHGRSLGGGVAVQLAARREPAAMVLESTFTSIPDVVGVPLVGLIVRHPFRSADVIGDLECPILLLHGADDTLIPKEHSEGLANLARDSRLVILPGGHNDFPRDETAFWDAVIPFVTRALAE